MARPYKKNADYFPHDANMRNDKRIKSLRAKFDFKGYAIFMMLLEDLTSSDHFRVEVKDITYELMSLDYGVSEDELKGIIDYCIKVDLIQMKDQYLQSRDLNEGLHPLMTRRRGLENDSKTPIDGVIVDNNYAITTQEPVKTELLQVSAPIVKDSKGKDIKEKKYYSLEEIKNLEVDPVVKGLMVYIQEKTEYVKLLKKQLSTEEAASLIAIFTKEEIKDVIGQMENFNNLTRKYTSVYRTCLQWLKNNRKWEKERQAVKGQNSMQTFNGLTAN
jgi:hypothetical protein